VRWRWVGGSDIFSNGKQKEKIENFQRFFEEGKGVCDVIDGLCAAVL